MSLPRVIPAALLVLALTAVFALQARPGAAQDADGMDHPIVQAGLDQLGGHGGQCYIFARNAVREATGMSIGRGYRQGYLDAGGVEVNPDNARAGDVLQIANPSNLGQYYPGMHTVIVIENLGNRTYKVIDSNWKWDEVVRIHQWKPRPASHLKLYAYRFDGAGTSGASAVATAPPASEDPGPAPALQVGDTATVDADGSCLNLRGGAGTGNRVLDCMPDGASVTVLSEAQTANGYTWVKVRASSGQEGWVASEYLEAAAGNAAQEPDPTPTATPSPPEDAPAEDTSAFAVGTKVEVATNGSCLYLRDDASLSGGIETCMGDGSTLTVLDGPVQADGYNWLRVETATGVVGWSALEFLVETN